MTTRITFLAAAIALTGGAALMVASSDAAGNPASRGDVVVFVTSQGLYYDSVVNGPLPPHGRFQLLEMGPNGLQTEFGPGDPGYLGGRWVHDLDGDGEVAYFSCPLLPPGRANP